MVNDVSGIGADTDGSDQPPRFQGTRTCTGLVRRYAAGSAP